MPLKTAFPFSALILLATAATAFAQPAAPTPAQSAAPTPALSPGQASRAAMAALTTATEPSAIQVAPGFKVELIHTVPKTDQGSWVALAFDPKGRLLAGDQYGGLYRLTLPALGSNAETKVERLDVVLTDPARPPATPATTPDAAAKAKATPPARIDVGAHGLLYAFDSLYVMNNERPENRGLWRLRDTNGDDQFDEVKFLREMRGGGEHGTHSLVLAPDGKSIYFANGNHTDLPIAMEKSRAVAWGEDHLLPRMWDARGHARNKFAPGGYIGRTDPDGKSIELFSLGFRNQFDLAFDQNGELFTYDSDMEWDQGTPWYLPTRINHAVDGGDYGWRSGAGRWPAYYADSLAEVVNIGPGSPTGLVFGTGAKFPAKFQRALFAADWTFGTLYAIHLTPDGASFRGEKTEFLSGKPLPLTDVLINPRDGAMYFAVGGRRTQSALYRVTYTGTESTAPASIPPPTAEAKTRRTLEALHADGTGPGAIDEAWPHLASPDRFVRFAARVAIEKQPAARWAERALTEPNPQAAIEALIALARVGDKSLQPRLLAALGNFNLASQPAHLRLPLLRAWQLAFTRMGKPSAEVCAVVAAKLEPQFPLRETPVPNYVRNGATGLFEVRGLAPGIETFMNRELVALLIYLDSPTVVAKAVPLLSVSEPATLTAEHLGGDALTARNDTYGSVVNSVGAGRADRQQIAYAYALRNATVGWTPKLRLEFFSWFSRTQNWKGGASFPGFIQNIRTESLEKVSDVAERAALDALSKPPAPKFLAGAISPKGPGRSYTLADAALLTPARLQGRDFAQGKALFAATACIVCHRFGNEGSGIGPDLTGAGNRYNVRDLLQNIVEPSAVISDQYGSEQIDKTDGSTVIGRVVGEENGDLLVMSNPFAPDEKTKVAISAVKARKPYPVSLMPPGLINALNENELADLVAYLLSSGNPNDAMFRR